MTTVCVKVLYKNKQIKTIERPLHETAGCSYVVYKGKHYPLQKGNVIDLSAGAGEERSANSSEPGPTSPEICSLQTPHVFSWDDEQMAVIEAEASARLLVDAGPGSGKTAVACARVAWLINTAGVEPGAIWLVSFTRTAVHELRTRIRASLSDPDAAAGIRIATIDSHAWSIHSGFSLDANLSGGYEANIKKVINLIEKNEGVFEYLSQVKHLFIDEAQDVVGSRVQLLLELINALPPEAGVTVLCDEAQAIYGFSEDESQGDVDGTLPEAIREYMADSFEEIQLAKNHRTTDPVLSRIFSDGRKLLKDKRKSATKKFDEIRALVQSQNHGALGGRHEDLENLPGGATNSFLLFRKRGEALEASSYLKTRAHRLRMSGLPVTVHEWVGRLFWDWTEPEMSKSEFESRWMRSAMPPDVDVGTAWSLMIRLVGQSSTRISVRRLAQKVASNSPPIELCLPDFGFDGPLVGTIHGAKGREADQVRLYLPPPLSADETGPEQCLEEARVIFVAASRARKQFLVGKGATRAMPRHLEPSGRSYTPYPFQGNVAKARALVEIGRCHDLDASGLTGRAFFSTAKDAEEAQRRIMGFSRKMVPLEAHVKKEMDWAYAVFTDGDQTRPVCVLNQQVNGDMFKIAKKVDDIVHLKRWKAPDQISYLRSFGIRTVAITPDNPVREILHAPWRDSGFMLAPLLLGYGMVYFRY